MTKILLVEDDKSLREIYGVRLLAEGYDIVSAGDGEEALAMAIKERPTLIISDVMMPKISGFDMLDILRSTTETRNIKVIMMTALSSEDQRIRGESLGADKYLVKSQVGIEDVVRVVHEVLEDKPAAAPAQYAQPAPQPVAQPTPQPTPQQYAQPAPAAQPVPQPYVAPEAPAPQPVTPLPTPTTAYSAPRPAGSSERIIEPLPSSQNPLTSPDINALLDRELAAEAGQAAPAASAPAIPSYAPPVQPPTAADMPSEYELSPEVGRQMIPQAPYAAPNNGVSSTDGQQPPTTPQA